MTAESPSLLIIYGSQTGQSKSIAENVKLRADDLKYRVELLSMDHSIEKVFFTDVSILICYVYILPFLPISIDALEGLPVISSHYIFNW